MLDPVGDSKNPFITPAKDFPKHRDASQEKDETSSSPVNVSISEKAQGLSAGDSPLTEALKKEFEEVFGLTGDRKELFLGKLDDILADNGVEA